MTINGVRVFAGLEKQINNQGYALYVLSPEEIAIVVGSSSKRSIKRIK